MIHVEEQGLLASVRSELVRARDERAHRLSVHRQVGQAAAAHNVLRLGDGLADPRRGALEREGALLELLLKLFALVVYAVLHDHTGHITYSRVGRVDEHHVHPIEQKLELIAQSARMTHPAP